MKNEIEQASINAINTKLQHLQKFVWLGSSSCHPAIETSVYKIWRFSKTIISFNVEHFLLIISIFTKRASLSIDCIYSCANLNKISTAYNDAEVKAC